MSGHRCPLWPHPLRSRTVRTVPHPFRVRFDQDATFEDFAANLHAPSRPALLSRYERDGRLIGAGYLDQGETSFSSVYFVFDPAQAQLSLGIVQRAARNRGSPPFGVNPLLSGLCVVGRVALRMRYKAAFFLTSSTRGPKNLDGREPGRQFRLF